MSEKSSDRHRACSVLGTIGTKKHTRKMKILSKSDPAYTIRGLNTKVWFVRDACRASVGKISMRGG